MQAGTSVPLLLVLYSPSTWLARLRRVPNLSLSINLANTLWPAQPACPKWLQTSHTSHIRGSLFQAHPSSAQATPSLSSRCSSYQVALSLARVAASLSLHRISPPQGLKPSTGSGWLWLPSYLLPSCCPKPGTSGSQLRLEPDPHPSSSTTNTQDRRPRPAPGPPPKQLLLHGASPYTPDYLQ